MAGIFGLATACVSIAAIAGEYVEVSGRKGVTQAYLWMANPNAQATVILFAGGKGKIKLQFNGNIRKDGNFLVRSRKLFLQQDLNVVVVDAPSDHYDSDGMFYGFRHSEAHAQDIKAVIQSVSEKSAVPVWLVGTSRGTESAVNSAIYLPGLYAGVVLTASVTLTTQKGTSILERELEQIRSPVLIVAHEEDGCFVTPPSDVHAIREELKHASQVKVKMFRGGLEPVSSACKAKSEHGFYGIEPQVVKAIADFIKRPHQAE